MNPSLFVEFVKKWFKVLAGAITERVNDAKTPPSYLFKTMLTPKLSADNRWDSTAVNKSIVAADIVALDSPLPIKKRPSISVAGGKIPKIGIKMAKTESLISDIRILESRGVTEAEIARAVFDDLGRCVSGINERLEFAFLQALSTGVTLIDDEDNAGAGIRIRFGYRKSNSYGAVKKWGESGYTPISDVERVLAAASERGDTIVTIMVDKTSYNLMRKSEEAKSLHTSSISNFTGHNMITPSPSQFNTIMEDEYNVKIVVVDRSVRVEIDGNQKPLKPFAKNTLVFLTTAKDEKVGSLVYGILAEESSPVTNVEYQKIDTYILTSKYSKNDPLTEFTSAQTIALPVIENADSIYILNTQEAQEVADDEVDDDDSITLYGANYSKIAVIEAMRAAGIRVGTNISDEKLVEKINSLSDADEAKLRKTINGVLIVTPTALSFTSAGGAEDVTAMGAGELTATSNQTWAAVSVAGRVATVTVGANNGAERTASITLTGNGRQVVVEVVQEAKPA